MIRTASSTPAIAATALSRRRLLVATLSAVGSAGLAGCAANGDASTTPGGASSSSGAAASKKVTLYCGADTNVQALWQKTLIPGFAKAHPEFPIDFIFSEHGTNDPQEQARLAASAQTGSPAPADVFDTGFVVSAAAAGQLVSISAKNVPQVGKVQKGLLIPVDGKAVPYRGSAVLLAYDSSTVTTPPKTLADLLSWIKANPGRFTYNSPSTGGSGQAFVATVLDSMIEPAQRKTLTTKADPGAEQGWDAGLAALRELDASIYQGVYPNGNQAVLDLLGKGQISMAPVWSDMYLSAVANDQLGKNIKVTQISEPSFTGGAAYLGIAKNATNIDGALALANFVLQPEQQAAIVTGIGGFPAIAVDSLPAQAKAKLAGTDPNRLRAGYSAEASNDLNRLWQQKVPV